MRIGEWRDAFRQDRKRRNVLAGINCVAVEAILVPDEDYMLEKFRHFPNMIDNHSF